MIESKNIVEQKMALRAAVKTRRAAMSDSERDSASRLLCQRLTDWLESRPEKTVGVYLSSPQEISLDSLIGWLLQNHYHVAAPRVDVEKQEMNFWRIDALQDVEYGPWNIRQPLERRRVENIPLILVPGLAFDDNGGRLGMGGGWYDRTLNASQTLVGIGFDWQIVPCVPLEGTDCRVHFVGSEQRWIEANPR